MRTILISLLAILCIVSCDRHEEIGNTGVFRFSPEKATLGPKGGVAVSYAEDFTQIWGITAYVDGELFFKIDVTNEDQTIPYTRSISDYCTIARPEKERVEVHLPPRNEGNFRIIITGEGYSETAKAGLYGGRFVVDQIVEE